MAKILSQQLPRTGFFLIERHPKGFKSIKKSRWKENFSVSFERCFSLINLEFRGKLNETAKLYITRSILVLQLDVNTPRGLTVGITESL